MALRGTKGSRRPPSILRTALWIVGPVLGFLFVCGLVAGVRLFSIQRDLRSARTLLVSAGDAVEDGRIAEARASLVEANDLLVSANNQLYESASLEAIGWLPVVHENIDSLQRSVGMALSLAGGGERLLQIAAPLEAADGTLEVPMRAGAIPVGPVVDAHLAAANLAAALPGPAEEQPRGLLVPAVADLQDQVFAEAVERRAQLTNLANGLELIADMSGADGPRRYLIAVANTAEMRGTGGMILSYGVLESAEGDFELPAFGSVDEVFLDQAVDPSVLGVPADELRRWGDLEVTRLWRNANVIPDFEVVAPRLAAMYEQATGLHADGVIQIDAHGLAAILEGIGPVTVPGVGEVTAANAVDLTLNQAYTLFPDRDQRQEVLGDVAEQVFDRLVEGEYDSLRPLGTALFRAALERHAMMWSSRTAASSPISFFGADGELPDAAAGDSLLFTLQNFSRNKLDYYIDTAVEVRGERPELRSGDVEVVVTVTNTAPPGQVEPSYVFGDPVSGTRPPGVYAGVASLYVPNGTAVLAGEGGTTPPTLTAEAGRAVVTWDVELRGGESATVTLRLRFPQRAPGQYRLELVPQPRVRPTVYEVAVEVDDRTASFDGPLLEPTAVDPS